MLSVGVRVVFAVGIDVAWICFGLICLCCSVSVFVLVLCLLCFMIWCDVFVCCGMLFCFVLCRECRV